MKKLKNTPILASYRSQLSEYLRGVMESFYPKCVPYYINCQLLVLIQFSFAIPNFSEETVLFNLRLDTKQK